MKKIRIVPGLFPVVGIWLALALWCWLRPADEISMSERRKLAQFPEANPEKILSGTFAEEFEDYSRDQFPVRDGFRTLKSLWESAVFGQKDHHGIYIEDGYAANIEYPLDRESVGRAAEKLTELYTEYMRGKTDRVWLSVIPDKSYYLADQGGYPALDYEELFSIMREKMEFAEYLDLTEHLSAEDYYRTDSHWRQENITEAAQFLAESMGGHLSGAWRQEVVKEDFRGVYFGQAALPMEGETISLLRGRVLDACRAYNLETGKTAGIYDLEKLEGRDPYEVYLSGASPLIRITNPLHEGERRLVLLGDSFSSSMAPLLAEAYSEITLVDIRYLDPSLVGEYVEFEGADVLFLYSVSLLNHSGAMR